MSRSPRGATLSLTARGKVVVAVLALLTLFQLIRLPSSQPPTSLPRPVVSLTSNWRRLNTSLPPTLWSLVRQSHLPASIRVHLPLERDEDQANLEALDPVFRHPLVDVRYVKDEGPATKFLPALREAFERAADGDLAALDEPVLVLDDDHIYSPVLVETLTRAFVEKKAAVALRGWRVREDLRWGVSGWEELQRHVVEGWKIRRPYQVGVITANEGYILSPSMLLPPSVRASLTPSLSDRDPLHPSGSSLSSINLAALDPSSIPLFSPPANAPESLHLVDDILLSGSLSAASTPRWVVPLPPPNPRSLDITPPARTQQEKDGGPRSPLEHHLLEHGMSRAQANDEVLGWFGDAWAKERDEASGGGEGSLWYDMRPEAERRRDGRVGEPEWAGWMSRTWSELAKYAFWKRARRRWGEAAVWN
ncbi:hypothetical protein JCM6882_007796 [Rhodosporidiobolus microsporus]